MNKKIPLPPKWPQPRVVKTDDWSIVLLLIAIVIGFVIGKYV